MHLRQQLSTLLVVLLANAAAFAQEKPHKSLAAKRTAEAIKIDGNLSEAVWKDAPQAIGFTEFRPVPFRKEDPANRTDVFLLYDNEGIYMGGYCHERTKDSISAELTGRDGFGNNDFIGIVFDTYLDKLNAFEYFVTPLGEQYDAKVAPNNNGNDEDFSWNAVWKSASAIHTDGWSFEMFIPFSAIRFSKKNVQDWGINIYRRRQKIAQQTSWNTIDPTINGALTQAGVWTGLENIKPPVRLQFSPYLSSYANHYPSNNPGQSNWNSSINGGVDVKYGISQALTLDLTLVPDFGQVQSDNQVLNLSPFEVKFNENRSFFTEGTELFNKGNLFYSRRIGGQPLHLYEVEGMIGSNEHIVKNPSETKLINATKVSGRLEHGLGIGFFNAITAAQYAEVEDNDKKQRKIETSPLTNYNILVLNQSLKHNSSISLVNTNVWRSGNDYDANVTAALFDFNDKKNTWNIGGKLANSNLVSYLPGNKTLSGYSHSLYFGKTSGRFQFSLSQDLTDAKFNSDDLGYFTNNNFLDHNLYAGYRWIKPNKVFNNFRVNFNASYSTRFKPNDFQNGSININGNGQLKNLWFINPFLGYEPRPNDFYEPRVDGRFFKGWVSKYGGFYVESNNAKKYSASINVFYVNRNLKNGYKVNYSLGQQYRFSNKFSVNYGVDIDYQKNNVGFAAIDGSNIVFGLRNRNTIENTLNLKYNFTNKMGLNTRVRHYWSRAEYTQFFNLLPNGELDASRNFSRNVNQNYNAFNVDAVFTWQFAAGSFINIVWKNSIYGFDRDVSEKYFKNFNNTISSPQNNNVSFKILYFLDYLQLKKKK